MESGHREIFSLIRNADVFLASLKMDWLCEKDDTPHDEESNTAVEMMGKRGVGGGRDFIRNRYGVVRRVVVVVVVSEDVMKNYMTGSGTSTWPVFYCYTSRAALEWWVFTRWYDRD